jgi:hypothetical protein
VGGIQVGGVGGGDGGLVAVVGGPDAPGVGRAIGSSECSIDIEGTVRADIAKR